MNAKLFYLSLEMLGFTKNSCVLQMNVDKIEYIYYYEICLVVIKTANGRVLYNEAVDLNIEREKALAAIATIRKEYA